MKMKEDTVFLLHNKIQKYSWGSEDFIESFTGRENQKKEPWAELWLGAHSKASSEIVIGNNNVELAKYIAENPEKALGSEIAGKYEGLPFLFKILSAAKPLSIQVHPSKEQAETGFDEEEKRLLPLDAKIRNYKDRNHKPEMMLALTPFYALSGIRAFEEIKEIITLLRLDAKLEEFNDLITTISEEKIKEFFNWLLNLKGRQKDKVRSNILRAAMLRRGCDHPLSMAIEWICKLDSFYPDDIGIAAPILLNTLEMFPGEALYMDAGIMHAYLSGSGLEIMANSDNVLRAGLTPKHIDISELMKVGVFKPVASHLIKPHIKGVEEVYDSFVEEFQLSKINLQNSLLIPALESAEILLVKQGEVSVIPQAGSELHLKKGQSAFISYSAEAYHLKGKAEIYRAKVNLVRTK